MPNQLIPIPVKTLNWSASGRDTIDLSGLVPTMAGLVCNVEAITFDVDFTPTLSAGTIKPEEVQNVIKTLTIKDGVRTLFDGSFASLRQFEMLERGKLSQPDNDLLATTERGGFGRVWRVSPPFAANPDDFKIPAAVFKGGRISVTYGALTDMTANLTALTAVIQPIVWVSLSHDVILSPMLERYEVLGTNGVAQSLEAMYLFAAMANSAAFDAITAGDFANITVIGNGISQEAIAAAALTRAYYDAMGSGHVTELAGENRAAPDDNAKVVTGTAVAASLLGLQPILWSPRGAKLTKLVWEAKPSLTIKWSGSQSTGYQLFTRILPRDTGSAAKYGSLIESGLGAKLTQGKVSTSTKKPLNGSDNGPYMALKFKLGK